MASEGERETEVDVSSDAYEQTIKCQPCGDQGKSRPIAGCCVNCQEYLCKECYDVHLIPSVTRKHVLLDKNNMIELKSKHMCPQHRDREIEYHCPTHSFLGCHTCCFKHQKSCKDVVCIAEVCSSTKTSEKLGQINQRLENITSICSELQAEIKSNLQTIAHNYSDVATAIRNFKTEILVLVDRLENEVIQKAKRVKKEETEKMQYMSQRIETLIRETENMTTAIQLLQKKEQAHDIYIMLVQTKDKVSALENQVQSCVCDREIKQLLFQANTDLMDNLKKPKGFGNLKVKNSDKMKYVRDIVCKSENDSNESKITGLALLANQKLLVTVRNTKNTVRLVDIYQNQILSILQLTSDFHGVCKITEKLAAVTLPFEKTIVFLQIDQRLAVDRMMEVNGAPWGIDYFDGRLVVGYTTPNKVEIIDMQGKVINIFSKGSNGETLFNLPYHLTINPNNKLIYVSNTGKNNVICMKFDGTVIATYKDNELRYPRQVTFDSKNMVYVCGAESNNVHQITEDCKKVKVILTRSDGLNHPIYILYQEQEGNFLIGQNKIKIYQREYTYL